MNSANTFLLELARKSALVLIFPLTAFRLAAADPGATSNSETQKEHSAPLFSIPAQRGQILDRNGEALAQTRVSYNLAMAFPQRPSMSDDEVLDFARRALLEARGLLGRDDLSFDEKEALRHYQNRDAAPMTFVQHLTPAEQEKIARAHPQYLTLQPVYQRFYPHGPLACHLLGYAALFGKLPEGAIENTRGRFGLEGRFDRQLRGKLGEFHISFDPTGKKIGEQVTIPPESGANLVTTLDVKIQGLCEQAMKEGCKRGAFVILDPNTGDILAMVSWPGFDLNTFVPKISAEEFKQLSDDPAIPMLDRVLHAPNSPGATFNLVVGLAALQSGKIGPDEKLSGPPSIDIGNITFRNWKRTDSGMLDFAEALTQSCDTWFAQTGVKVGPQLIVDYARQLGFGQMTGIPLDESDGGIPNGKRGNKAPEKMSDTEVANLSIGQGQVQVTPLQVAQAMGVVGTGGVFHQTRLVQKVQSADGKIIDSYDVHIKQQVAIDKAVMSSIRQGMVDAVSGPTGTAHGAQVSNVEVAGKTGMAFWGRKEAEKSASWFAGFAPAQQPRYAFAVICEHDAELDNAPDKLSAPQLAGKVLKELFKDDTGAHGEPAH